MVLACCWSSIVALLMERCSITEAVTSGRRSQIQCLYNLILFLCNHCKNSFVDIEFVVRIFWSGFAYFSKPLLYQCIIETSHHVTHYTPFWNTLITTAAPLAAAFAALTVWRTSHDEGCKAWRAFGIFMWVYIYRLSFWTRLTITIDQQNIQDCLLHICHALLYTSVVSCWQFLSQFDC